MTYRELLIALQELTEDQLDSEVAIFDGDISIYALEDTVLSCEMKDDDNLCLDMLGRNYPILVLQ